MEIQADRLRPEILLTALVSRLADLQDSRVDTDATLITPSSPSPYAGRRALVANALIAALDREVQNGNSGFIALPAIAEASSDLVPDLQTEELRFVARFLNTDREIRFQEVEAGTVDERSTRAWSRLVQYQQRTDRVKLTEAGRTWLRILRFRDTWLFEDKEVEKLLTCLRNDLFEQIPIVALEIIGSIRAFAETLNAVLESASFRELVIQYLDRRRHYAEMVEKCQQTSNEALETMRSEMFRKRYENWLETRLQGEIPDLRDIKEYVMRVHRATTSLGRVWVGLLRAVSNNKRPMVGIQRFDQALDRYLADPPSDAVNRRVLDGICGWGAGLPIMSFRDLAGVLPPPPENPNPKPVWYSTDRSEADSHLATWLSKHRDLILARLAERGAMPLLDLLQETEFALSSIQDVSAAFGLYVVTDPLGHEHEVVVRSSGALAATTTEDHAILASDVTIGLAGQTRGPGAGGRNGPRTVGQRLVDQGPDLTATRLTHAPEPNQSGEERRATF